MTPKEALEILTNPLKLVEIEYYGGFSGAEAAYKSAVDAFNTAKQALEKQIPKKVEWTVSNSWGKARKQPVCPVCDYYLIETHFIGDGEKITYCDTCGQAIDWSDAK